MIDLMAKIPWKYVSLERGSYWFRRDKEKRTRLPADPHSPEFAAAYRALLSGVMPANSSRPKHAPGSLGWLAAQYLESGTVQRLAPIRQARGREQLRQDDARAVRVGCGTRTRQREPRSRGAMQTRARYQTNNDGFSLPR